MSGFFIGVDVGTGSARAGLFDGAGRLLGAARRDIAIWHGPGAMVEQSSNDIWGAVCAAVGEAVAASGVAPDRVAGLGFDATCSLVVLDAGGNPLPVGPSEDPERNIIVWMDHRAIPQAELINRTGHPVLRYVGGAISPEMQTPKILWLKQNRPEIHARAAHFLDLADYLSWRATGSLERSVCTVTCKWTYLAHERRWDARYFEAIGLGELVHNDFARIGSKVVDIGSALGSGLTAEAAAALGLAPGTPVGASLIDAHSGGLGSLAPDDPAGQIALVMGTSCCTMTLTPQARFVEGVWGPYFGAMTPGLWLLEGGQSAYGAAIDHLLRLHPAHDRALEAARAAGRPLTGHLEAEAIRLAGGIGKAAGLAAAIHVVPEFLGNRAPHADPHASAVVAGLDLDESGAALVALYVAGVCGLCYGTRQILEAQAARGIRPTRAVVSGGAGQSALLRRILADATGLSVGVPETPEPVLLGAGMLGAVACGRHASLAEASRAMSRTGEVIAPQGAAVRAFHDRKFAAFAILQSAERDVRRTMAG